MLRHTFCTLSMMRGVTQSVVQKWMGHTDLKTTLRYTHTLSKLPEPIVKKLE